MIVSERLCVNMGSLLIVEVKGYWKSCIHLTLTHALTLRRHSHRDKKELLSTFEHEHDVLSLSIYLCSYCVPFGQQSFGVSGIQ